MLYKWTIPHEHVHTLRHHPEIFLSIISDPVVQHLTLSPVVDGDFLPDEPANLFNNAVDIDYLAGVNDMDGHLFTSSDIPSFNKKNEAIAV